MAKVELRSYPESMFVSLLARGFMALWHGIVALLA